MNYFTEEFCLQCLNYLKIMKWRKLALFGADTSSTRLQNSVKKFKLFKVKKNTLKVQEKKN